jgi:hypothetical protein
MVGWQADFSTTSSCARRAEANLSLMQQPFSVQYVAHHKTWKAREKQCGVQRKRRNYTKKKHTRSDDYKNSDPMDRGRLHVSDSVYDSMYDLHTSVLEV